ncbi:MAG TPA: SDR family oxidoreductase [Polyangiaceae bacterium]|nr:SDR family oxidoreductase [Polyangiaceae bacterium]
MSTLQKFDLQGKTALVTGGAGILGKHFCQGLMEAGANVAVVDVDAAAATACAESLGPRAAGFGCDVASPESVQSCVAAALARFGAIDVLHNNAATKTRDLKALFAPFESYSLAIWREVMSVNIDGMFLMAQAVGRHMVERGKGGAVIQMGSIYGLVGPDWRIYEGSDYLGGPINTPAVYSASKAAVVGLTRWLATHWARHGIRVNCLVPGGVASGQNKTFSDLYSARVPMGRMAEADEMVPALLYLASDASSYVTGQVLAVDGGWTCW